MTKQIHIAQVLPALNEGGVERGTLDIASAVSNDGMKSTVISNGGKLVSELVQQGSGHIQLPVHSKNPWLIWNNGRRIRELIRENEIDLLHVRSRAPAWSSVYAAKQTGTPLVTTFHGQYGSSPSIKKLYNASMLRGHTTIAVSKFIKNHIETTYPSHTSHLELIHRGIDTHYFSPDQINEETRQSLYSSWMSALNHSMSNAGKLILLPGRVTRLKGHSNFLSAINLLRKEGQDVIGVIVGGFDKTSNYFKELCTEVEDLGLQQQIHFAGSSSNMREVYANADIVVSSSTKPEAFGRTLCEAQAMEKLVVASNHGGSIETTSSEQAFGLFKPDSAESLAQALLKALRLDEKSSQGIRKRNRAHIVQNFSLHKMQSETIRVYHNVLAELNLYSI